MVVGHATSAAVRTRVLVHQLGTSWVHKLLHCICALPCSAEDLASGRIRRAGHHSVGQSIYGDHGRPATRTCIFEDEQAPVGIPMLQQGDGTGPHCYQNEHSRQTSEAVVCRGPLQSMSAMPKGAAHLAVQSSQ
jgi:hypothetical protein